MIFRVEARELSRLAIQDEFRLLITILLLLISFVSNSSAQEVRQQLDIRGYPIDPKAQWIAGSAWALYLNGEIDLNSGERLEKFIKQNNVPDQVMGFSEFAWGKLVWGNGPWKHHQEASAAHRRRCSKGRSHSPFPFRSWRLLQRVYPFLRWRGFSFSTEGISLWDSQVRIF